MSILQADGLEFSDGSVLESLYGIIPQDKRMIFYQAAAPTGWTKLTQVSAPGDLDGSAIRVTSSAVDQLLELQTLHPQCLRLQRHLLVFNLLMQQEASDHIHYLSVNVLPSPREQEK